MKRREFTRNLGYGWIGLNLSFLVGCRDDSPAFGVGPEDEGAAQALEFLAGELRGVEFVAPVCARRVETNTPLEQLLDGLPQNSTNLVDALHMQVAADFESGRIVDIDGWKISLSECLLLAGAARIQGLTSSTELAKRPYQEQAFMDIELWGPDQTLVGEIFNPIGNGRGGFWLRVASPVNGSMRLLLDGRELATHFEPGVITASLDPDFMQEVIDEPGVHELVLIDRSRRLQQSVGFLEVSERPPMATLSDGKESTVFCEPGNWGPRTAVVGEPFNRQPDGSAGFWLRIGCAPESAVMMLDGVELPTTVRSDMLVTARVEHFAKLARGEYPLVLFDRATGERLSIGDLKIQ
jgi:hypothetical protein